MKTNRSKDEHGSIVVILAITITSILFSVSMMISMVKEKSIKGRIEDSLFLAGRSLLSEYNPYIMNKYGIFVLDRDNKKLSKDIAYYINQNMPQIIVSDVEIYRDEFSPFDIELFENELVYYSKFNLAEKILKRNIDKVGKAELESRIDKPEERRLENKQIIELLPSQGDKSSFAGIKELYEILKNWDKLLETGKNKILIDDYILSHFQYFTSERKNTVFNNEVEYILAGSLDDEKNKNRFKRKVILLRNLVNIAVIESNPDMKAKITTIAAATGPLAPVTYGLTLETWALAESVNDYKILERGGKLPFVKNSNDWAVDIGNISEGASEGYIDKGVENGMDYSDYLRLFLFFTSKEMKVKRIQDLIQLNTKLNYDKDFTFSQGILGVKYKVNIGGETYVFSETY